MTERSRSKASRLSSHCNRYAVCRHGRSTHPTDGDHQPSLRAMQAATSYAMRAAPGPHRAASARRLTADARQPSATAAAPCCSRPAAALPRRHVAARALHYPLSQQEEREEPLRDIFTAARACRLYTCLPPLNGQPQPQEQSPQNDGLLPRVLLTLLCKGLASKLEEEGQVVRLPTLCKYEDFVRVSKAIMQQGRSVGGQEMLIRRALNSIIPGGSGL